MEPVEIAIVERGETYVLTAQPVEDGWWPTITVPVDDGRPIPVWGPAFVALASNGPYPTPGRCLLALAEAVVSELFGVRT